MLRFQVTVKPFPLLFSEPGCALTRPDESTMVSSSSGNVEMTPEVEPDLTVALDAVHVWKSVSGRTPLELLGASAIHSALEFAHDEHDWVVVKLSAGVVESVTLSV